MQYVYLLNSLTTPFLEYYMIFHHLYAYRYRPYFLIALFGIKSVPVFGHTDSPCIASLRLGCFWHGCCIYCLGNIQVPYHSIIAFHYHFWVTPRPYPSLSVFITYCIVFQHILMRFISFFKFCFTKISNICSDITHHTPCPHIIWLSLSEPNPPIYRWMIYLNAPLSFKWLVCLSQ